MFVLSFSEPEGGVVLVRRHFHESRLVCVCVGLSKLRKPAGSQFARPSILTPPKVNNTETHTVCSPPFTRFVLHVREWLLNFLNIFIYSAPNVGTE